MNLIQVQIDSDLKEVLSGFNALSDPLRLRIVDLLGSQELSVGELRSQLDVGWSKLSFHLKQLKEAKLLRAHQRGRSIYYSLNLSQLIILEEYLTTHRIFAPIVPDSSVKVEMKNSRSTF